MPPPAPIPNKAKSKLDRQKATEPAKSETKDESSQAESVPSKAEANDGDTEPMAKVLKIAPKWKAKKEDQDENLPEEEFPSLPSEPVSGSAGGGGTPATSGDQFGTNDMAQEEQELDSEIVYALATGTVTAKTGSLIQLTNWIRSRRDCIDELYDNQNKSGSRGGMRNQEVRGQGDHTRGGLPSPRP